MKTITKPGEGIIQALRDLRPAIEEGNEEALMKASSIADSLVSLRRVRAALIDDLP